jgi:hypothetical protein
MGISILARGFDCRGGEAPLARTHRTLPPSRCRPQDDSQGAPLHYERHYDGRSERGDDDNRSPNRFHAARKCTRGANLK